MVKFVELKPPNVNYPGTRYANASITAKQLAHVGEGCRKVGLVINKPSSVSS